MKTAARAVRYPLLWLILLFGGLAVAGVSLADAVSELPPPWDQRLRPIPSTDLSGAEPNIRDALTEARTEIDRLLADPATDDDTLATAYGRLGALLVLREVETPANLALGNAATLQPKEPRWPYYAGYVAMMAGANERALGYFEQAKALNPNYPPLYLRLGKVHFDLSDFAAAKTNLARVADAPGLAAAANVYLGQIANLERRYEDAIAHLTKVLELDPDATEAHWPLAQAYRALRQDDLAREHMALVEPRTPPAKDPLLEQLRGAAKQSVPAFERGIYAVEHRRYDEAVRELAAGLDAAPDNVPARVSYARALYLAGDREAAERELDRVLEADPNQTLALFLEGVLAQQNGEREQAATLYRRVLEQEPDHPGVLFYLANLDLESGRFEPAAAGYRRALEAEQPPPPARLLALIAEHRGGASDAEIAAKLDVLIQAHPDDPMLAYAEACLLAAAENPNVRNPARASELVSTLAFQLPGPPQMRAQALVQAANGDTEAAAATLSQAIAMSGGWLPPQTQALLDRELAAYREGRRDLEPWPAGDPLLSPPPFDPMGPFRDYPASVPY